MKERERNEKTRGRNYGDGIRDPTPGEMRVISINVERSRLRKRRGVNANYSERSARIPDFNYRAGKRRRLTLERITESST